MAALTWREVAAPDLGTSLQGYQQFSSLLNSALGQARDGLNRVDADISAEANNRIALAALQEQDPAALKAALQSGTILGNVDPRRVSAQTIAMLGQRPGQLLAQANQEQALAESQYNFNQQQTTDARAPQLAQLRALAQADDQAGMAAYVAANPGLLEGIGYKTVADFQTALQNDTRNAVGIAGGRQDIINSRDSNTRAWNADARAQTELGMSQERQGWERQRFNWSAADRKADEDAQAALAGIMESVDPNNLETVRNAVFNGSLATASPKVRAAAYGRLSSMYPGLFTPGEFGVAGGAGGSPMTGTMGGGRMSEMEAIFSNEGGVDPKTGKFLTSSAGAIGPGQLMPATAPDAMAAAGFSRNDQRWRTDPAINRAASTAYFNQLKQRYGGDGVKAAAAYNVGIGNFDKAVARARQKGNADYWWSELPAETKKYVTDFQAKTGGGSTPAVQIGAALRTGQDRIGRSSAEVLVGLAGDNANAREVTARLRGQGGAFAGTNVQFVQSRLNDIVERSKVDGRATINYAQAGQILSDALNQNNNSWGITNFLNGNSVRVNSNGDRIDNGYVTQEIDRFRNNNVVQDAVREIDTATSVARMQDADKAFTDANRDLQAALNRSVTQRGLGNAQGNNPDNITLLRARVAAAKVALDSARRTTEGANAPIQAPRPVATTAGSPSTTGMWATAFSNAVSRVDLPPVKNREEVRREARAALSTPTRSATTRTPALANRGSQAARDALNWQP